MHRRPVPPAVLLLLVLSLGSGCGGGAGDASDDPAAGSSEASSASAQPTATSETYFAERDSDAVNVVVARAQRSGARTVAPRQMARCGRAGDEQGYPAWRRCWHGLLDPFARDLRAVASTLGEMAGQDLPPGCTRRLGAGREEFARSGERVDGLLAGIDAEARAAQVRSMETYEEVVRSVGEGFAPYFRTLTRACYSPSDLESIDAAASAGASPGPTPQG